MKKVFTNGVFDLFHAGHYKLLARAKSYGDYLLVGVCSDESCEMNKRKPFQSWKARAQVVKQLPFVDEVIKTPWSKDLDNDFYLNNKIDWQIQGDTGSNFDKAKELGLLKIIGRTENISTTKILGILGTTNQHILYEGPFKNVVQVSYENELFVIKYAKLTEEKKYEFALPDHRSEIEYNTIMTFNKVLNEPEFLIKPLCIDNEREIIIFYSAPANSVSLFEKFMSNEINIDLLLGIARGLAKMHSATYNDISLSRRFGDSVVFLRLKIEKQCRDITHDPILQDEIDAFINDSLKIKIALLHGDFAPHNILTWDNKYLFINFEESSYADPALDAGYFLAHIYIHYFLTDNPEFKVASELVLKEYLGNVSFSDNDIVTRIWKYVGIFILSRVDGRSSAVCIRDEGIKEKLRSFGKELFLTGKIKTIIDSSPILVN